MGVSKVTKGNKTRWRARYGKKSLGFHKTKTLALEAVERWKEFGEIDYEKDTRAQDVPDEVFEKELKAIPADQPLGIYDVEPIQPPKKKTLLQRIFRR